MMVAISDSVHAVQHGLLGVQILDDRLVSSLLFGLAVVAIGLQFVQIHRNCALPSFTM